MAVGASALSEGVFHILNISLSDAVERTAEAAQIAAPALIAEAAWIEGLRQTGERRRRGTGGRHRLAVALMSDAQAASAGRCSRTGEEFQETGKPLARGEARRGDRSSRNCWNDRSKTENREVLKAERTCSAFFVSPQRREEHRGLATDPHRPAQTLAQE